MSYVLSAALVIALLFQGASHTAGQTPTHASETSLRATLQAGYDQTTRPDTPTQIDVKYFIRSVQVVDIAKQQFSHTALLAFTWEDPRLAWTASSYSNITELDINWSWRPLFVIGNSAYGVEQIGGSNNDYGTSVYNNGTVQWLVMVTPTTACMVDVTYFPMDSQECNIYLVYLRHNYGFNLEFNLTMTEVLLPIYLENAEWDLISSSVQIMNAATCCPVANMGYLDVKIKFDRPPTFYMNTFLLPNILLSIGLVWPFLLPQESGGRLGFALTILLTYTVVLSMTSSFLPSTSRQTPVIGTYLLGIFFLCFIAVCNVGIHEILYCAKKPPPGYMKTLFRKLRPIVFLECGKRKSSKVEDQVLTVEDVLPNSKGKDQEDPKPTSGEKDRSDGNR